MRWTVPPVVTRTVAGAGSTSAELLRVTREMLVIPGQIWLAIAEVGGVAVLAAWRVVVWIGLAAYGLAGAALRWAQAHVRPAYGVIAVCVAAAAALVGSQFVDYRGVSVGAPAYTEVETVAPAPQVDRESTGSAHSWAAIPVAIAALAATAVAARGRWRAARLLVPLGLAVVAISLAVDAPKGLDEGGATVAYMGVEAVLLEGFWAQLIAGAILACCGLLLASHLRLASDRAARRPAGRDRRAIRSRPVAQPPMGGETTSP
jgi:hypothetical protein